MTFTFVGGNVDGRALEVDCDSIENAPIIWNIADPIAFDYTPPKKGQMPAKDGSYTRYRLTPIKRKYHLFYVYVKEGLSETDVLRKLILGYRP